MSWRRRQLRLLWVLAPIVLALVVVWHLVTWVTTPAIAASGTRVRVLLDAEPMTVRVAGTDLRTEPAPAKPPGGPLEIRVQSAGLLVLGAGGTPYVLDEDRLVVRWDGRAEVRYERADGTTVARRQIGSLHVIKRKGRLRLVLHTDMEVYLTGVVEAEMGGRFPAAALQAQAVAARSFARSARERRQKLDWDVYSTTMDQVFRAPSEQPNVVQAVRETLGELVLFDGKPQRAYYASTCGGRTRDGRERFRDVPARPFRSVPCETCGDSPLYRWERSVSRKQLAALGIPVGRKPIEAAAVKRSGRGDWIRLRIRPRGGKWRELTIGKLRGAVRLPSPWVTGAVSTRSGLLLSGRGFGHGVGLCQWGAAGRARAGKDYREILAHYYPGSEIGRIAPPDTETEK